ncbi:MAG: DUF2384 domain-containing protein [Gammaproteobacteria bacterium]|nr:MAG: DUF2384 domain-containing protein [Gammaproteobacteria bacterium]
MKVIALDLEGTLISNAVSQIPRPWLYEFLIACESLATRVVIFTTVPEQIFRKVAKLLVEEKFAPEWFERIEYVFWDMKTKNLNFIDPNISDRIVLIDDFQDYIHRGQEKNWIKIDSFNSPYDENDQELWRVYKILAERFENEELKTLKDASRDNFEFSAGIELGSWRTAKIEYAATELMDGNRNAALRWMQTPLAIFENKSPLAHAQSKSGTQDVMDLIGRLEHGVFS